ncbi:MAG: thiosulfate oxidation carrier complex protein SoxZ [Nitrospirae bacterium]|nr:thiosulfate oxidation carrier complex protein SoxZ [Nitrospirota bacterium]
MPETIPQELLELKGKETQKPRIILKPKTPKKGDIIEVRVKIEHPQDIGGRKDRITGKILPRHYITKIETFWDNEPLCSYDATPGLSSDPILAFKLKVDRSAPLKVVMTCNVGNRFENVMDIKV